MVLFFFKVSSMENEITSISSMENASNLEVEGRIETPGKRNIQMAAIQGSSLKESHGCILIVPRAGMDMIVEIGTL
jgi:hypothetical protein